jgi:hypothetical protein
MKSAFPAVTAVPLALMISLAAFIPAYAITSVEVADEKPESGIVDTFDQTGEEEPAYEGVVVNGILSSPATEQAVVYMTQQAAPAVPVAPQPKTYIPPRPSAPALQVAEEPVTEETIEAPAAEPVITPDPADASQQVLGVSTSRDDLEEHAAEQRALLASVTAQQSNLQNFVIIGLLLFMVIIPLLAGNLLLQAKTIARTNVKARKARSSR